MKKALKKAAQNKLPPGEMIIIMMRLSFKESDYDIVKKYIELSGGSKEDFITDEVVELGDNQEYINRVIDFMKSGEIQYLTVEV